jgi:hypothetical protein
MVYTTPVGSKYESESQFQNLTVDIVEVQTIGGIVQLRGDFNARIIVLPNTIDTKDLCELLHAPKLAKTKQPSAVAKRQTTTLVLVVGAASSWTYVVTLGCSFSMVGHLVMNHGSSLVWQLGGITLSIMLLVHM